MLLSIIARFGAVGVTTDPFLANLALVKDRTLWASDIAVAKTAEKLMPEYRASDGCSGLVCA